MPIYAADEEVTMAYFMCPKCDFIYKPDRGDPKQSVKPGTPFEMLCDSWTCSECNKAEKKQFLRIFRG